MPKVESEGLAFKGRLVLVDSLRRSIEYAFHLFRLASRKPSHGCAPRSRDGLTGKSAKARTLQVLQRSVVRPQVRVRAHSARSEGCGLIADG